MTPRNKVADLDGSPEQDFVRKTYKGMNEIDIPSKKWVSMKWTPHKGVAKTETPKGMNEMTPLNKT